MDTVVLAGARHPALPRLRWCARERARRGSCTGSDPQQEVVDEAEDRGVGADAEREGKQRDGGEARVLQQLTDGYPDVVQQLVTPRELAGDGPIPARCSLDGSEGAKRCEPVARPSKIPVRPLPPLLWRLQMDVYRPRNAGGKTLPVLVFFNIAPERNAAALSTGRGRRLRRRTTSWQFFPTSATRASSPTRCAPDASDS